MEIDFNLRQIMEPMGITVFLYLIIFLITLSFFIRFWLALPFWNQEIKAYRSLSLSLYILSLNMLQTGSPKSCSLFAVMKPV